MHGRGSLAACQLLKVASTSLQRNQGCLLCAGALSDISVQMANVSCKGPQAPVPISGAGALSSLAPGFTGVTFTQAVSGVVLRVSCMAGHGRGG